MPPKSIGSTRVEISWNLSCPPAGSSTKGQLRKPAGELQGVAVEQINQEAAAAT